MDRSTFQWYEESVWEMVPTKQQIFHIAESNFAASALATPTLRESNFRTTLRQNHAMARPRGQVKLPELAYLALTREYLGAVPGTG
jgi:hypothetical protein